MSDLFVKRRGLGLGEDHSQNKEHLLPVSATRPVTTRIHRPGALIKRKLVGSQSQGRIPGDCGGRTLQAGHYPTPRPERQRDRRYRKAHLVHVAVATV